MKISGGMGYNREQVLKQFPVLDNKSYKKSDYTGENYERRIPKSVIFNTNYLKVFKGASTIYDFLWAHITRGKLRNDSLNVYEKYYVQRQKLACAFPFRVLSRELYMSHHTIKKHLDNLEKAGVIGIDKVRLDKARNQNIYVLGYYKILNEKPIEVLYFDEIYG